jgi:PAS domain S-box-containing protein
MNNKNLIIRYISYFFISSFSLVLIINIFKQNELEYSLNEYEKFISKEYSKYYDEYKNNSELIYFNEFIKNKELIKIFKNISQNNIENSKKELNKSFKDSFSFYKTLDVFNISFYLPTNEFLLSMEENFKDSNILNIVDKVIVDKKELNSFRILDDKYYLIFSKPIFDENLKFLGVINIEFDFDSFFNENNLYIKAFNKTKETTISKINNYFDFLIILIISANFVIFYFSFKLRYFKVQKLIVDKKYQELYKQIDDYIIMVETDLEGVITYATKPFSKISGYSRKELIGKNINLLKHPDVSQEFFQKLWNELKVNKLWEGEIKNQDRYGNSYWIKGVIFPKYNFDNEIVGYISIRTNITDTKQLEKINKLLKEDLSNKLNEIKIKDKSLVDSTKVQLMSKILDSLGHQWKQPILNISSLIYNLKLLLKDEENNKDKFELIQEAEFELKNLSEVLNEIKYLFQQNQEEKTNLVDVIRESVLVIQEELKANNIKIKYDSKNEIFTNIMFNELKNIILNMIKNSILQTKLSKQSEVTVIISVSKEDYLLIKIEDNIKENDENIFKNRYINTHLDLVKLFVEKNRGLFWIKNSKYNTSYYIKLKSENI